jgi:DNA-directed RNA polymerase subunit RPC12/RpoP
MPDEPTPVVFDDDAVGSTQSIGRASDDGKGRIFPCDRCGADLVFSIGQQSLQCPYCGAVKQIEIPADQEIVEQDLEAMLQHLQELKEEGDEDQSATGEHVVRCDACGADVIFQGTLTSTNCPYCASPLQRDKIHDAVRRIAVQGMLPFLVAKERAAENLRTWVQSLWFAPNEFKKQGANGKFSGVYLPYFTFDAMTFTRYTGQRGDHYFEMVADADGKNTRQERRTRWTSVGGQFQRFFDDVLVVAVTGQQPELLQTLEPWPLGKCVPFNQELLAGFFSRTYDIELAECFHTGKERMESALTSEVRQRIGGDEQSITGQKTAYSALSFKHLLLPVWLLVYRYHDKPYRIAVNAATGEVQGERPYSWVKITFAVLSVLAVVLTIVALSQR